MENTLKCKRVLTLSLHVLANIGLKIKLRDIFILFYRIKHGVFRKKPTTLLSLNKLLK